MTFEEKLVFACEIGNQFMPMDTFCRIHFHVFPHIEGDGFQPGESCWEVTAACLDGQDRGYTQIVGKTPEEALDKVIAAFRSKAERMVRLKQVAAEGADRWQKLADMIPVALTQTSE